MFDVGLELDLAGLARILVKLRREGKQASTEQFSTQPPDLTSAMETQNLVSKLEGVDSHAWKVAVSPQGDFVVAALHPYVQNSLKKHIRWRPGMKLEVEIAVKLGKDLPILSDSVYTTATIVEAIRDVFLGAELVWSAVKEGGSLSYPLFLADRLGNMGYVLGPLLVPSTLDTCMGTPLHVSLNGNSLYDASAQHPTGNVITWLIGYANDRSRPRASLSVGSIITTGSLCGAFDIAEPGRIRIQLGDQANFDFILTNQK